ncbi:hypothetical protein [Actinokineospora bangkokensis]|uniref:Uncharacterized protein n=1 Tax=Actinokineospora bangkokensis TaxID=1193682 RepID=A0A1Q9LPY1_9PSEU|nr:hypothetical protein [Actinokineospora bangkokensis]OLR94106.1 hypothetical protein BJP25_09805 [Actinokineospora bangkokensis]
MTATPLTRRALLRAAAAAAVAAPVLAACTTGADVPEGPDPLAALAARARADAALATAVATALPALAAPAQELARVRGEHATALQAEVDRLSPPPSSAAPSAPPASPTPPADAAAAKAALVDALTAAEGEASAVVPTAPRYRAGLVASVAAACACLREVLG